MKTLILFLSLTISYLFILSSCNQQSEVIDKNYKIPDALKLVENFNKGKLPIEKATLINGAVEIITTENEIVLFITENGKEDLMYILQQNPSKPRLQLRESISSAQIMFFHRTLLVNSINKDLRLFFNIDEKIPSYFSQLEVGTTLHGYGLVRQPGVKLTYDKMDDFHGIRTIYDIKKEVKGNQASMRAAPDAIVSAAVECGCCTSSTLSVCESLVAGDCDSGGAGSTSCSITTTSGASCSTSCGSDANGSCCNDTSNDSEGG